MDNKIQFPTIEKEAMTELELLNLPNNYLVSSIYPAYTDRNSFIIRLENVSKKTIPIDKLKLGKEYQVVNALEDPQDSDLVIPPMGVISLKCKI